MIPKSLRKIGFYVSPILSLIAILVGFAVIIVFVDLYNTGPNIDVEWYVALIIIEFMTINLSLKHGSDGFKKLKRYKRHARRVKAAREHGR
ncbi:hypothetical protein ABID56_001588 [Alkalibacillus flavidus]|uniref:Uncharacterized protein n=1 Tax=Alkalibacillus flavidus TaxID=546021 RepID=A0ABV2KV92_9BACI